MDNTQAYQLAVNVLSRNEDVRGLSTSQRLQLSKLFVKCVLAGYDRGYREGSEKVSNELTEYYENLPKEVTRSEARTM